MQLKRLHIYSLVVVACLIAPVILLRPPRAEAQSPSEKLVCVTAARANLRSGPATDSRVNWVVYKHMPLTIVEKKEQWLRVRDVDGDLHWIYESLISDKEDCVTVVSDLANIRRGPGTNFKKWFSVKRYTSFRKTGEQNQWVRVEYEGEVMWVFRTLVWPTQG